MQAATDLGMRAQILSYSRSRGVFAGVAIEGSTLRPDNFANSVLYNREVTAREIVRGGLPTPPAGREFVAFLDQNVGVQPSTEARTERDK
jgi:lipid-binding SYLF domain-containing protein